MSRFSWDWKFVWEILPSLLSGLQTTVWITILAMILAMVIGLVLTIIRMARIPLLSAATTGVVHVLRGTPLLIQLYFLFFILPGYGITMSPLLTGVIGLGLYSGAMASEIYRAGIESIPRAQWEASLSLNLPLPWMWARVILPQAIRPTVPMFGNQLIVMFKDSALLSAIAVTEVLSIARQVAQDNYRFIEPYTMVGLLFFAVSYVSVLGIRMLERWSTKRG
jgi:polar amino acid transport system permease protein